MGLEQQDRGSSLAEVLVAMALGLIVLGTATTTLISGQRSSRDTVARLETTADSRVSVEAMSRLLRTAVRSGADPNATAVTTASVQQVVFYANDATTSTPPYVGGPSRVTYRIDTVAKELVEERVAAGAWNSTTGAYSYTGTPRVRVLAEDVVVPQPASVFRYYSEITSACLQAASCTPLPVVGSGSSAAVAPTALASIKAVGITLALDTPKVRNGTGASIRAFVHLPNGTEAVTG